MKNHHDELVKMLETFSAGVDRSSEFASRIEVYILEHFAEDSDLSDLSHALACYSPTGGDYLYDSESLAKVVDGALRILRRRDESDRKRPGL